MFTLFPWASVVPSPEPLGLLQAGMCGVFFVFVRVLQSVVPCIRANVGLTRAILAS